MTKRLTQVDVDALVKGGRPATEPAVEVVPYNFQRPPRVVKEQRAALEASINRFAYVLQAFLATRLRAPVDLALRGLEEVPYGEFLLSLEDPCVAFAFRTCGVGGDQGILSMGTPLAFHVVDRLFGGTGQSQAPQRSLTALEQSVVRGVADRTLMLLGESWGHGVIGHLLGYESNPEALRVAMADEPALVANFDFGLGTFRSFFTLCIPLTVLEGPMPARSPGRPGAASAWRDKIETALRQVRVVIAARLPAVRLPAKTITRLEVGQVLEPGVALDSPVEVRINGQLRYRATLGRLQRRVAVEITEVAASPDQARPRHRRVM